MISTTNFRLRGLAWLAILVMAAASFAGQASSLPQPICGDGTIEAGEQCGDGNTIDGDGCSMTCQIENAPMACALGPDQTGHGYHGAVNTCTGLIGLSLGNEFLAYHDRLSVGQGIAGFTATGWRNVALSLPRVKLDLGSPVIVTASSEMHTTLSQTVGGVDHFEPMPGLHLKVTKQGGVIRVKDPSQTVMEFQEKCVASGWYDLISVTDPHGIATQYDYDGNCKLSSVLAPVGTVGTAGDVRFTWMAGKLTQILYGPGNAPHTTVTLSAYGPDPAFLGSVGQPCSGNLQQDCVTTLMWSGSGLLGSVNFAKGAQINNLAQIHRYSNGPVSRISGDRSECRYQPSDSVLMSVKCSGDNEALLHYYVAQSASHPDVSTKVLFKTQVGAGYPYWRNVDSFGNITSSVHQTEPNKKAKYVYSYQGNDLMTGQIYTPASGVEAPRTVATYFYQDADAATFGLPTRVTFPDDYVSSAFTYEIKGGNVFTKTKQDLIIAGNNELVPYPVWEYVRNSDGTVSQIKVGGQPYVGIAYTAEKVPNRYFIPGANRDVWTATYQGTTGLPLVMNDKFNSRTTEVTGYNQFALPNALKDPDYEMAWVRDGIARATQTDIVDKRNAANNVMVTNTFDEAGQNFQASQSFVDGWQNSGSTSSVFDQNGIPASNSAQDSNSGTTSAGSFAKNFVPAGNLECVPLACEDFTIAGYAATGKPRGCGLGVCGR